MLNLTYVNIQGKIIQGQESNPLLKANERLKQENESLLKDKDMAYGQITALSKSLEALRKDLKDKENMVVFAYLYDILSNNTRSFLYREN